MLGDDDDLAIVNKDPTIASGWWTNNGKTILIKTHSVGNTSVMVKDRRDYNRVVEIKITSEYLGGSFEIVGEKAVIILVVNDASVQASIENELKAMAQALSGTTYLFNSSTKTVDIDYTLAGQKGGKHKGTYNWSVNSLAVKVDNTSAGYGFGADDNNSLIIEVSNLAEAYRTKYPEAGVHTVRLGHFLSRK